MAYYQSDGYQNSGQNSYQSQQYNTGGHYGYSQQPHQQHQQGHYGGGTVRYPPMGAYHHQAPAYTPSQQKNGSNPFVASKQQGAAGYHYPGTTGYTQDSNYYVPQSQKNYPTRPQSNSAPGYSYNSYAYPASNPASATATNYSMYGYSGNQTGQHQQHQPQQQQTAQPQPPQYTPSTSDTANESNITPQQQQAIQNWIEEKHGTNTGATRGVGRGSFNHGGGRSRFGPAVSTAPFTGGQNKRFQRGYPKDPQRAANYFCEACKVSCGTSDAYTTHLNGKAHKKKLANPMPSIPSTGKLFKCDVCDVMCTGKDAFKAHITGTKHKKVVKLYEVMGKPLPEIKDAPVALADLPTLGVHLQKTGKPLINFVKSTKELSMKAGEDEEVTTATVEEEISDQVQTSGGKKKSKSKKRNTRADKTLSRPLSTGLEGFVDAFGVPIHHVTQRDVFIPAPRSDQWQWDPEHIDRYIIESSLRRNRFDDFSILDVHRKIYPTQKELDSLYGTLEDVEKSLNVISLKLHTEQIDKLKESLQTATEDDNTQMSTEPAPEENSTQTSQKEMVIDNGGENNGDSMVVQEKSDATDEKKMDTITTEQQDSVRVIQGFQRVGDASKGINLSGNLHAELVVICTEKPTRNLLQRIVDMLPQIFTDVSKFSYQVTPQPDLAEFQVVYSEEEISACVTVTLTSLGMREEAQQEEEAKADESNGVLDRSCCQQALCQMRRTKWFQGQAINLPSYILIIRVLKDISRRVPAWTCLDSWMLELLLQKVLSISPPEFSRPGDAVRNVVACIASGFFLPGAPGLMDPCEKDKVDSSGLLTAQMREDLTFSAQHALRLISFKQLYKVLGLETPPKMQDIKDAFSSPRLGMRRFTPYRARIRTKRKVSTTPDSDKKQKTDEAPTDSGETQPQTS